MLDSTTLEPLAPELLWILCLAFVIAFLLAFSVGANDVSNSFGTSVGSRVLTVTQACILATLCEAAGATLLGYSVCDTFRRKMYNVKLYDGAQRELMLGALACLIGSAAWNLIATALKMPISGTHSIVGATIGFSVVLRGWDSIRWTDMLKIVASWFASPLLSGLISSLIYISIAKTIIRKVDPLRFGLKALPLFYGATVFINVASIVIDGPEVFNLNKLKWYEGLFISLVCATITICCVALILVPRMRQQILDELVARKVSRNNQKLAASKKEATTRLSAAYDNVTFKPDSTDPTSVSGNYQQAQTKLKREAPLKPDDQNQPQAKREEHQRTTTDQPATGPASADSSVPRPPLMPKPAHLVRQQQLEEIDLSCLAPIPMVSGGTGALSKQVKDVELGGGQVQEARHGSQQQIIEGFGGERYEVARLFASLQIMTACFASFAHGTNDVSNAVAPLIPIWNIYADGIEDITQHTPIWILAFGSIGICTGLWAWGRAVMGTIADGLTKITPSKGFSIELGAAISVLLATKFGLPISTTHCKVGSLVIVGLVSSKFLAQDHLLSNMATTGDEKEPAGNNGEKNSSDSVDWKMFSGIAATWIVTVPFAGLASALVMLILKWVAM